MGVKGNNGNSTTSNGGRGRSYGTMLLLAFGAALLGALILHKLRERRIFTLILKQKDQDLVSLQLLFQKEKEYSQEVTMKYEEMKAKIFNLRNHKMELDRRLLETQSTVSSLKDELNTLDVELRSLRLERDRLVSEKENDPRIAALFRGLKQKEAKIEELKQRLLQSASSNVAASNETHLETFRDVKGENVHDNEAKDETGPNEEHSHRVGRHRNKDRRTSKSGMKIKMTSDDKNKDLNIPTRGRQELVGGVKEKRWKNRRLDGTGKNNKVAASERVNDYDHQVHRRKIKEVKVSRNSRILKTRH